jgi:hypothetical protein
MLVLMTEAMKNLLYWFEKSGVRAGNVGRLRRRSIRTVVGGLIGYGGSKV